MVRASCVDSMHAAGVCPRQVRVPNFVICIAAAPLTSWDSSHLEGSTSPLCRLEWGGKEFTLHLIKEKWRRSYCYENNLHVDRPVAISS